MITVSFESESLLSLAQERAPFLVVPFLTRGEVSYTTARHLTQKSRLARPPTALRETASDGRLIPTPDIRKITAAGGVGLKELGVIRGSKLFSLIISPFDYDEAGNIISSYGLIEIRLTSSFPFPDKPEDISRALKRKTLRAIREKIPATSGSRIRIVVSEDGIYRITGKELEAAGVTLTGFTPENITLWNRGRQIPILLETGGKNAFTADCAFEFYGTANRLNCPDGRPDMYRDPFSSENIYFLTVDSAVAVQRFIFESGAQGRADDATDLTDNSFSQSTHLEEDQRYDRLDASDMDQPSERRDHWFWTSVPSQGLKRLSFRIAYPDTTAMRPLQVRAAFHGLTASERFSSADEPVACRHAAELFINETRMLGTEWYGQTANIVGAGVERRIPQSILHHGVNTLSVYNAGSGSPGASELALNWIDLTYQRLYAADHDYLKFSAPPGSKPGLYKFLIRNFSAPSISVFRPNGSKFKDLTVKKAEEDGTGSGYAVSLQVYVQSPEEEFIAVADIGKLTPARIETDLNACLYSYDYSAECVIVTSGRITNMSRSKGDGIDPINRLVSWYESRGIKTLVVSAEQIYDEFNFGIKSPVAIRSFLSYAYHNWSAPPGYVLLAGNGGRNPNRDPDDLIPTMMMQTYNFGAAASDNYLVCIDGEDPLPDIAIGRIPATKEAELAAAVDKIIASSSRGNLGWQNNVVLVAGEEAEFHRQTDSLARSVVPPSFFVKRVYTSVKDAEADSKYFGGTERLAGQVNEGAILVNYMGHGGGAVWADNGILTNDDVSRLSNAGKFPFVASMTCFTGAFDGGTGPPLASTLLFAAGKGAVGILASSGLGWLLNDFFLDRELISSLLDTSFAGYGVGFSVMLAKARYYASSFFWPQAVSMLNQFNLIGDPGTVLSIPTESLRVDLESHIVLPGRDIKGTISGAPPNGKAVIQLTYCGGEVVSLAETEVDANGCGSFSIGSPDGSKSPSQLRVYAYNHSDHASASANLSDDAAYLSVENISAFLRGKEVRIKISGTIKTDKLLVSAAFDGKVYAAGATVGLAPKFSFLLPLSLAGANEYSSTFDVSTDTLRPGDTIKGLLMVRFSDGAQDSSLEASCVVAGAADVSAYSRQGYPNINTSISAVSDSVIRIQGMVYKWSSDNVRNVRVDFYEGSDSSGTFLGSTRIDLDSTRATKASVPITLPFGQHNLSMSVVFDSLTEGYDVDPGDNCASNNIFVNLLSADSTGNVTLDSIATLSGADPGGIYRVDTSLPSLFHQPFLNMARFRNGDSRFIHFVPVRARSRTNYSLSLNMSNLDSVSEAGAGSIRLYCYDLRTRTLNLVGGNCVGGILTCDLSEPGTFTAAFSSDKSPPRLSLSVGDQFFTNGDFVPPDPRFFIIISDESGVDLRKGSFSISLDERAVDASVVVIPDSIDNPNSVGVALQLQLREGRHAVQVTARDASGNISPPAEVEFTVRSDFSLRVFGAYPNPFTDHTLIALELTSGNPIDEVELKIFSVSGRLVRTIRYPSSNPLESLGLLQGGTGVPTSVGYHEAWWDGTDNYGNQVSNGVYFCRIRIKSDGATLEEILKVARLR